MKKIDIELIDLAHDRIIQGIGQHLILEEDHFRYFISAHLEVHPNLVEGEYQIKSEFMHYESVFLKRSITGLKIQFVPDKHDLSQYDVWCVSIVIQGAGEDLEIKKETESGARELFNILTDYLLNKLDLSSPENNS